MQSQHLMHMQPMNMMATYYSSNNNITTDHIQQYLDENKALILKIVESQNSGKINECAENQARLQRNLMYLASLAESQPQPASVHLQYAAGPTGAHYMHHQQAQAMTQQELMAARSSMLYSQQQPYPALQPQVGMSSSMGGGGLHCGADTSAGFSNFGASGSTEARPHASESFYLKSLDEGNS